MNAMSTLLILIGVFIVINTFNGNLVGVANHTLKFNTDWSSPVTPAEKQTAFPLTGKSTSSGG
jgi:hypothetical protein